MAPVVPPRRPRMAAVHRHVTRRHRSHVTRGALLRPGPARPPSKVREQDGEDAEVARGVVR